MSLRLIFELIERFASEDTMPGAPARMTFVIGMTATTAATVQGGRA
jgi:hypothetical protein